MNKAGTYLAMLVLILIAESFIAGPALGEAPPELNTLSLVFENDLFYEDADKHYTNGMGLIWIPNGDSPPPDWAQSAARLIPWFPKNNHTRHGYAIGQKMYTPRDTSLANPPLDARPYAGWLYGLIGLSIETEKKLDQIALTIGLVGPASFAEEVQQFSHELTYSGEPAGWDTQLDNEAGFILTSQRSWRKTAIRTYAGLEVDLTSHIGGSLGNVYTYLNTGVTLRCGPQLPNDYGPIRIQPSSPGSASFTPGHFWDWYLFAGVDGRAIARNIFLDGNTFRDSRSVDKKPFVGEFQFGIVLTLQKLRINYTQVLRTNEYKSQEDNDGFGAVTMTLLF